MLDLKSSEHSSIDCRLYFLLTGTGLLQSTVDALFHVPFVPDNFLYHAYRLATHRIVPTAYRLALRSNTLPTGMFCIRS